MSSFDSSSGYWSSELAKAEALIHAHLPRADHDSIPAKEARLSMALQLLLLDRLDTIANRLDK